jgi:valyl-tRNA synthetase
MKLGNISKMETVANAIDGALSFRVQSNEYFIPISGNINLEEEIKKINDELKYTEGFLKSVQGKLANERFVNNAPEQVLQNERNKESDALSKIETLRASLASLK